MKLSFLAKLVLTSLLALTQSLGIHAQSDCAAANGNYINESIVRGIERQMIADSPIRISRRKSIVVHWIADPVFGNQSPPFHAACYVELKINVTVKRKWRRDAEGNIYVRGYFPNDTGFVGLESFNVHDVRLSHLTSVGEHYYAGIIKDWITANYPISQLIFIIPALRRGLRGGPALSDGVELAEEEQIKGAVELEGELSDASAVRAFKVISDKDDEMWDFPEMDEDEFDEKSEMDYMENKLNPENEVNEGEDLN